MVSELARGDWEDLRAEGLNPTLDDFDRLNQLALRLTDGAETTAANFPRIGWAGDVPFHEPTVQALAWYHERAAKNLAALEDRLARACAALRAAPDELKCETPSRLERLCEAAAVELGKPLTRNEPQLRADYDLTLREIRRRLKKGADDDRND